MPAQQSVIKCRIKTMTSQRRSVISYLLVLLVLCCRATEALIKEWHPPDTDWQNHNNWVGGRLPCWRSKVIMPEEVVISVFLNGSVAWSELIMPQTGELVLDNDVTFNVDDDDTRNCNKDEEIRFENWKPGSWFNPDDWLIIESDGIVNQQPLAIPHSERIPCAHDSVHLSKRHSLSVDFSRVHSLTVGQVKYGDQLLTTEEWRSRLTGPDWKYQVHNPPHSVYLNGTDCQDVVGCRCGHDVDVMQMVCSNAGTLCSNQQLECPDSFRPPGHCCDMCGAMLKITVDERSFTKSSLDRLVDSMLVEDRWPGSQSYSYRTGDNVVHLIIVDNTTNERSVKVATKLHDYLNKDKTSSNLYGILELEMVQSGLSYAATHHLTPEELRVIATNLTTVFSMFILFAIVVAALYFYKKHGLTDSREEVSVGFARFQNDPVAGNVEIAIDASFEQQSPSNHQESPFTEAPEIPDTSPDTCHDQESTKTSSSVKVPAAWKKFTRAFTNPLFGDPAAAAGRMSGRWTMSSLMKTTATQENPIYNMNIPDSSLAAEAAEVAEIIATTTTTTAEIVETTIEELNGLAEGTESNVDAFPAVADDETPAEGTMEDVSLDGGLVAAAAAAAAAAGSKHPLKTLWKKATKKFIPADPPTSSDAEQTASQQPEDEMQLTLSEETSD